MASFGLWSRSILASLLSATLVVDPLFADTVPAGQDVFAEILHEKSFSLNSLMQKHAAEFALLSPDAQKKLKVLGEQAGNKNVQISGRKIQTAGGPQLRLVVSAGKQSVTLDVIDQEEAFVRINGVLLTYGEIFAIDPALERLQSALASKNSREPASLRITGVNVIRFDELTRPTAEQWQELDELRDKSRK